MIYVLLISLIILYCFYWFKFQDGPHLKPHHHHPHLAHKKKNNLDINIESLHLKKHHLLPPPKKILTPKIIDIYIPIIICIALIITVLLSHSYTTLSIILIFVITMITIFLRPRGINEAYPASIGAIIIMLTGEVSLDNILDITNKISGASLTIIATIVMAVILESFGFFHWVAAKLTALSKGSGYRLYWYIQLLCFLMTLLFNNDGSILITTPILILVLRNLKLKPKEQIPYLLSGALIATASSAPIGVSNITNLIALNIVHMTLYMHTAMMFVPCTLGLATMSFLMYRALKKKLPAKLPLSSQNLEETFFSNFSTLSSGRLSLDSSKKRTRFMVKVLAFVFIMRCMLFVASYFSIPIEIVAIIGSLVLLTWRWYYLRVNPIDILKKTPWHILIFAFSMYVIIYGLQNIGLIDAIIKFAEPIVTQNLFNASLLMGTIITLLSNIFNNHPALMVGTIALSNMGLNPITLKIIYLANIIGSDMGSLILPIGTLASLMWFYILKQNKIKISWKDYTSLTIKVIPITVLVTLILLYFWVTLVFA